MITVQPATPPSTPGVQGRAIRIRSDRDGWSGETFVCVPSEHAHLLSEEDDVFVPLIALLALIRREDADLEGLEVDAALLRNVSAALRQHAAWRMIAEVPVIHNARPMHVRRQPAPGAAVFFSGGIDSQFSLVRHTEGRSSDPEASHDRDVDFALHLLHSRRPDDLAMSHPETLRLERAANALGVKLVPVWTNMMTFCPELSDHWADIGHGAGLASVMHVLGRGIGVGIMASSHSYGRLIPWASSPITDPLYSSSGVRIIHDGSTFSRVEKTEAIAGNPAALASLNVCDRKVPGVGYVNCGRCQKCLRTMITLDLFGKGSNRDCPSFEWKDYGPERFARVFLRNASESSFAKEILAASRDTRPDIAAACETALRRSRWLSPISRVEAKVKYTTIGKRYRTELVGLRNRTYRQLGWGK